jgi:hypothetical protein
MAPRKNDDLGEAEVQKNVDAEHDQGYVGVKVDPRPNSAYSLESGPDSPSAVEADGVRAVQHEPGKENA